MNGRRRVGGGETVTQRNQNSRELIENKWFEESGRASVVKFELKASDLVCDTAELEEKLSFAWSPPIYGHHESTTHSTHNLGPRRKRINI